MRGFVIRWSRSLHPCVLKSRTCWCRVTMRIQYGCGIGISGGRSSWLCCLHSSSIVPINPCIDSSQLLILFFSIFFGSFIVTFNVVALGGRVSFFQSFAILSYCIFPIFLSLMIQRLLRFFQIRNRTFTLIFLFSAVIWSIICKFVVL